MMFFNLCLALLWLAGASAGEVGTKSVLSNVNRVPSTKPEGFKQQQQPQYIGSLPVESSVVLHQEVPPRNVVQQDIQDQGPFPQSGVVGRPVLPSGGQVSQQQYPYYVSQEGQQQPYYVAQQVQQSPYYYPQQVQQYPYYSPQQGQPQPFYVSQHVPQQQQGLYQYAQVPQQQQQQGQYQLGQYGQVPAPVQSTRYVQFVPYVTQWPQQHTRPQIIEVDALTAPIQFLIRSASGHLQFQQAQPLQQQLQPVQRNRSEEQTHAVGYGVTGRPVAQDSRPIVQHNRRTHEVKPVVVEEVQPIVAQGERPLAGTVPDESIQSSQAHAPASSLTTATGSHVSPQQSGSQPVDPKVPY